MSRSLRFVVGAVLWLSLSCDAGNEPRASDDDDVASAEDDDADGAEGDSDDEPIPDASRKADASFRDAAIRDAAVARDASSDASTAEPTNSDGTTASKSSSAITELERYLTMPAPRPAIEQQPFAAIPLTRADADKAKKLLWDDLANTIRETRKAEVGATESMARTIPGKSGGHSLRYFLARRGSTPATGRSLFISMHGGGSAPAATNDSQWKNQIALVDGYNPKDAIWVAPRAPIDDWNMWFVDSMDALLERLITDMIVFEGIDPNKVYINGYSAGGDGVYQLGPRMAERWAGAGMSAGHPNSASPLNLRNVPFAIHVGGNDTAFDRNKKGEEWGKQLEALSAGDPGGYLNQWQIHAGRPHWMELDDAVSIPFLQKQTRNPYPNKIVWRQAEVTRPHLYWLAVDADNQKFQAEVRATLNAQDVTLSGVKGLTKLTIRFADEMLDLDKPVRIQHDAREVFAGKVSRTIGVLARTLAERNDPSMLFSGEVSVSLK